MAEWSNTAEEARRLIGLGFRVAPGYAPLTGGRCGCKSPTCRRPGKHPLRIALTTRGTNDVRVATEWWTEFPESGLIVMTGPESGVWVLDVDRDAGGYGSLRRLERRFGPLPATRQAGTGGGGRHYYWRHPGTVVPSGTSLFGNGLDARGDGAYVVAPPSPHKSGGSYEWYLERAPAEAPSWLLEVASQY